MPLTYQPFAAAPQLEELRHELKMNVPDWERAASSAAGLGLIGLAARRHGFAKWALLLAGSALALRGLTGRCAVCNYLELDRRHGQKGVPGNRGTRVEESAEVYCDAGRLYNFWRDLEQLPRIMRHVESVREIGNRRSHWEVKGPLGVNLEWDAEIISEEPGKQLAWQSLPNATVRNAGSVWFEPLGNGSTRVKVAFEIDPPAGSLGVAVADLLGSSPQKNLAEDLARFKEFAERELRGSA